MSGVLFTPPNCDKAKRYPALPVVHLFGGVKEQTAGIYARRMAVDYLTTLPMVDENRIGLLGVWSTKS
jgi:fermentation-respiration switch protein FrsA (DUF1100 family)